MPYIISLILLVCISGCGDFISQSKNCIPPVSYISTEKNSFISYKLVDQTLWMSYDSLRVSESGEWLLQVVEKNRPSIKESAHDAVEIEIHPPGTLLWLSGKAKTRTPYGLATAFHSTMTYLNGKIGGKSVWIPAFYLSRLSNEKNELNMTSNRMIGLDEFKHDWSCLNH